MITWEVGLYAVFMIQAVKHLTVLWLREMLSYQGFTCALEASYDYEGRTYIYDLQAEWYGEFLRILDEVDDLSSEDGEGEEDDSMGDYFSRN